jgi:hypothetical protein
MHPLVRQAKLLSDLPQWLAAAVEFEHRLVVGGAARLGGVERSLVLLAQLLGLIKRIHV